MASWAERISGSETISIRGTPQRFRSTRLPEKLSEWMSLPASSSMWMRVMPMRLVFPSSSTTASM